MNILIIDNKDNHVIEQYNLNKGQTYPIPVGYKIIHREYSNIFERVWVEKE